MKYKKVRKMLALTLAGSMVFSNGALVTMAKQNDEYTEANLKNDGGVGGTVFGENGTVKNEDGSNSPQTYSWKTQPTKIPMTKVIWNP